MSEGVLKYLKKSASLYPDKPAVIDSAGIVSFAELEAMAKSVGSYLAKLIKPGDAVLVYMDKSADVLACMFGIVYAGGVYVPVDKVVPQKRLRDLADKIKAEYVICGNENIEGLNCIRAVNILNSEIDKALLEKVERKRKDSDILYITATSGTTGTPKCVAVSHKAVETFIEEFIRVSEITGDDVIGNQAPFDFDISVKDIYSSLKLGATLVLIPRHFFRIPTQLLDYLEKYGVTTLIWAVSALNLVSNFKGHEYKLLPGLKKVIFSGEPMSVKSYNKWKNAYPKVRFFNMYGPSEITCNCTYYEVEDDFSGDVLPIGKAFGHCKIYLVGEDAKLVTAPYENAEIYVASQSMSEGYVADDKANEAFVYMDFSDDKLYKTGDIAYYDDSGNLVFAGRTDRQVKHMGYRVELTEIEKNILSYEGVSETYVLLKNGRIYAYYTGNVANKELLEALKSHLPEYMIPILKKIDTMPLNKNGKVDKERLYEGNY